jgi:hypothetical protein
MPSDASDSATFTFGDRSTVFSRMVAIMTRYHGLACAASIRLNLQQMLHPMTDSTLLDQLLSSGRLVNQLVLHEPKDVS